MPEIHRRRFTGEKDLPEAPFLERRSRNQARTRRLCALSGPAGSREGHKDSTEGLAKAKTHSFDDSRGRPTPKRDRKSTRLNSSHGYISYAVFCLKKKKKALSKLVQFLCRPAQTRRTTSIFRTHAQILLQGRVSLARLSRLQHNENTPTCDLLTYLLVRQEDNVLALMALRVGGNHLAHDYVPVKQIPISAMSISTYDLSQSFFLILRQNLFIFFFFNDPAPPEISPFPLPAPLPI